LSDLAQLTAAGLAAIRRAHEAVVAPLLPAGYRLWDVHAHLGDDADGTSQTWQDLVARMDAHGIDHTNVFTFAREDMAGFAEANDLVLDAARASGGRLVPYARAHPDPADEAELRRALELGARGVKLHPLRGRFGFDDPGVERAVRVADEHRVPVLLHAGRGVDPYAVTVANLMRRYPGAPLILAHCAMSDLHDVAERTAGLPNMVLDTSLWNPLEVQVLVSEVAPERLVYGTDAPYYDPFSVLAKLVLPLRRGGASDALIRAALFDTPQLIAGGQPLGELSAPLDAGVGRVPVGCLRAHEYLQQATVQVWLKERDVIGVLPLARRALDSVSHPWAAVASDLLDLAAVTWPVEVAHAPRDEILACSWTTFKLIDFADVIAINTPLEKP
jgi:predicted TIM-barrel fold metal-dependent hydrolase